MNIFAQYPTWSGFGLIILTEACRQIAIRARGVVRANSCWSRRAFAAAFLPLVMTSMVFSWCTRLSNNAVADGKVVPILACIFGLIVILVALIPVGLFITRVAFDLFGRAAGGVVSGVSQVPGMGNMRLGSSFGGIGWKKCRPREWPDYISANYVAGQPEAVSAVCAQIGIGIRKRLTGAMPGKPIAVMLLVGPSGVGKTETAKALAKVMARFVNSSMEPLTLDMSEFYDRHTAARLVGPPPGYIGSDQGGQLTGAMERNPNRVILFDEVEKADPSVHTMFLQMFDEGRLTDASTGKPVSFANTIIFLTSNLCQEEIGQIMTSGEDDTTKHLQVLETLKCGDDRGRRLPPELLGRINAVIPYKSLKDADLIEVIQRWLVANRIREYDASELFVSVKGLAQKFGVRGMLNGVEKIVYGA